MAEVDGKIVMKAPDGRLFRVPKDQVATVARDLSWSQASDEEASKRLAEREQYAKFGGTGQQALAAGEQVFRTASMGLLPGTGTDDEISQREQVLRRESPVVSLGAQAAGTVLPALAGGALARGALSVAGLTAGRALPLAGALGETISVPTAGLVGARGLGLATAAAEGLTGGLADEIEQARYETRDVSAGNVLLYGLGGEIVGRALPKAIGLGVGRIKRALTPLEEAAGEGIGDALGATEARSLPERARLARELPADAPDRMQMLKDTAPEQYARMGKEGAASFDRIVDLTRQMGDTSSSERVSARLRETMADNSPAQVEWFTGQKERLSKLSQEIRKPLRAPAGPTSADEFLASIADEEARADIAHEINDAITERLKDYGVADATEGSRHWKTVEHEIVGERLEKLGVKPERSASLAESPGLKGFANKFDAIVDSTLRRMDGTVDNTEQFLILREAKQDLQRLSKKMSLVDAPQDAILHDDFRKVVDNGYRDLMSGLGDEALFGNAARIERDINGAWHDKTLRGIGISEQDLTRKVDVDFRTGRLIHESDPAKVRSFFKGDAVDRALAQKRIDMVLEGAEEMAAAQERYKTWNPDEIKALRNEVAKFRAESRLADEMQIAKGYEAPKAPKTAAVAASVGEHLAEGALDKVAGAAGAGIGGIVGGPVGAGLGYVVGEGAKRFAKRLVGLDAAGRAATKQAARNFAGVGLGYAARVAGRAGEIGAAPATTALARFTGEYSGPEESFAAKRRILDDEAVSPGVLYETIGASLGDVARVNPDLYQAIAARTAQKIRYLRENLPPGIQSTLFYPNGTPPSRSALRDWAVQWNTVMHPESVLQDLNTGTATAQQMQILKESDADTYAQLRADLIEQVAGNYAAVPTITKLQLDLLLGADGLAGPMFFSAAADMIGQAQQQRSEQRPERSPSEQRLAAGESAGAAKGPSGLEAIKTSVTNRAA